MRTAGRNERICAMAGKYQIVYKPEGKYADRPNDDGEGENRSCVIVRLTNGTYTEDICRVGFARRNTKNPDVSFGEMLDRMITSARKAVVLLNEQFALEEGLQ